MKRLHVLLSSALSLVLSVAFSTAHAALPAEAADAFADMTTAATDVIAAVWPVIGLVLAAFVTIKLVKRGAAKI